MSTLGAAVVGWDSRMGKLIKDEPIWFLDTSARTVLVTEKWRAKAGAELTPVEKRTMLVCEDIKSACGMAMWPKTLYECGISFVALFENPNIEKSWDCFNNVMKLGGPIVDTVDLIVRRIWDMPYAEDIRGWMSLTLGIGMAVKGVGECNALYDRAIEIIDPGLTSETQGAERQTAIRKIDIALMKAAKTLSDLVKTVSYLAISIISALAYFVFKTMFVPSWVFLSCTTAALCSTYFSKIWDVVVLKGVTENGLENQAV